MEMATSVTETQLDAPLQKLVTYTNNLKSKNDKLTDENSRLKSDLSKAKSNNSRIRRIPNKKDDKKDKENTEEENGN